MKITKDWIYHKSFNLVMPGVHKKVKHTLKILQRLLQSFNMRLTMLWTLHMAGLN